MTDHWFCSSCGATVPMGSMHYCPNAPRSEGAVTASGAPAFPTPRDIAEYRKWALVISSQNERRDGKPMTLRDAQGSADYLVRWLLSPLPTKEGQ